MRALIDSEEIEARVEGLGYELVEVEWAGSEHRPLLRVRIDLYDSSPERGVSVGDCEEVSRALEGWLDRRGEVPEGYTLEVSSPGVERPLRKLRDWRRFTGREVAVRGPRPFVGKATYLEGKLQEVAGPDGDERITLLRSNGEEVEIPLREISRAHLIFRWQ